MARVRGEYSVRVHIYKGFVVFLELWLLVSHV